jgi:hypothetical protein
MDGVLNRGLMAQDMKATILVVESMAPVLINGLMEVDIQENGMKIRYMASVYISGSMEEVLKALGLITICMDRVSMCGLMAVVMKVLMLKIKNMVLEFIHTPMVVLTKDSGQMVNNTVREPSLLHRVHKDKEFGKKEKESNGWMKIMIQISNLNMSNEYKKYSKIYLNLSMNKSILYIRPYKLLL